MLLHHTKTTRGKWSSNRRQVQSWASPNFSPRWQDCSMCKTRCHGKTTKTWLDKTNYANYTIPSPHCGQIIKNLERGFEATPVALPLLGSDFGFRKRSVSLHRWGETPTGLQNRLNSIMIMKFE